jgi:WD40 repeat protein
LPPDNRTFASAGDDQTIRLWHAPDLEDIRVLKGHTAPVRSLAFSADGKRLASGGNDRTVRVWEVETGRALITLDGHNHPVRAVAFAPRWQETFRRREQPGPHLGLGE